MEIINNIVVELKKNFSFLTLAGYAWEPVNVYNEGDAEHIFADLRLRSESLARTITFSLYTRPSVEIDVYITDNTKSKSLDLKSYENYKQGNPPHYVPNYKIDTTDLQTSVEELSAHIRRLMEADLKGVVFSTNWISFPVFDPRDDY